MKQRTHWASFFIDKNTAVYCEKKQQQQQQKIDETRNYLLDEIRHNDLMSENHKKVCKTLNCYCFLFFFMLSVVVFKFLDFGCHSCRYYDFCSRIKSLHNNCTN